MKTNEYADAYRQRDDARVPPPDMGVFLAQCGCSHWANDHCPHCGHCNECDCEGFKGE